MQWASENLPSSYFYSSADDDMMIDVATLDDVIMKKANTTSHLPYFPFICVHGIVSSFIGFILNCTATNAFFSIIDNLILLLIIL